MRTLPIVIVAGLAACVSISDEELAQRQQAFAFDVTIVQAVPEEAVSCVDPGLTIDLQVDPTMAGVVVQPVVTLTGGVVQELPDVEVPASGQLQLIDERALPCASGRCDVEVGVTLSTAEGASASASTTVQRVAAAQPSVSREGFISDGALVEGVDLAAALAGSGGTVDAAVFPVVYAVLEDPLFADVSAEEFGSLQMVVCPEGQLTTSPDCEVLDPIGQQALLGAVGADQRVVAVETAQLAQLMCDAEGNFEFYVGYHDDLCGAEGVVPILEPLRLGGDCDGDGLTPGQGDCDDTNAEVLPGAEEICNGIDDDCDEALDPAEIDGDGDGYVACDAWQGSGTAPGLGDCDDGLFEVNPGVVEVCNGIDDNCVDGIDEGFSLVVAWEDLDSDGLGAGKMLEVCELAKGLVDNDDDCDDGNAAAGQPLRESHCPDGDGDGLGTIDAGLWQLHCPGDQPKGWLPASQGECNDCDDLDSGTGAPSLYCTDRDGDGLGSADPLDEVLSCDGLGLAQVCDDCDDLDGEVGAITWFLDSDSDDLGDASTSMSQCDSPGGNWVLNADDCNDGDAGVGVFYVDSDGDGFGFGAPTCDAGYSLPNADNDDDCDDTDSSFRPGRWRRGTSYGTGSLQDALNIAGGDPTVEICGELAGGDVAVGSTVNRIQGTPGKSALVGDGSSSVLVVQRDGVTVADLEIRGGGGTQGAGIWHLGTGELALDGVVVTDNHADAAVGQGGGLWSEGSLLLVDSHIVDNSAFMGGGVWANGSVVVDLGTRVESNHAEDGGGGVFLGAQANSLVGFGALRGNDAVRGGGVFVVGEAGLGALRLVANSADVGGQLFVDGAVAPGALVTVNGGEWAGGVADLGGGAFVDGLSRGLTLDGVLLTGHRAQAEGGAVYTLGQTTLIGGTLTANEALGEPPDSPGLMLPEVGHDVAVVGPNAFLDVLGPVTWDSDPDGLETRGSSIGMPMPSPQGFDPTALPPDFMCDESGCL